MNDNCEKIEDLAKIHQICHVHLSNPLGRKLPAKSDNYDYRKLVSQLSDCGYRGRISIECDTFDKPKSANDSVHFLKRVISMEEDSVLNIDKMV